MVALWYTPDEHLQSSLIVSEVVSNFQTPVGPSTTSYKQLHCIPKKHATMSPHHSTETAIIAGHDEIVEAIDAGEVCALVLLDLGAAFDTSTCASLSFWSDWRSAQLV